jgi:hypothetical protein
LEGQLAPESSVDDVVLCPGTSALSASAITRMPETTSSSRIAHASASATRFFNGIQLLPQI